MAFQDHFGAQICDQWCKSRELDHISDATFPVEQDRFAEEIQAWVVSQYTQSPRLTFSCMSRIDIPPPLQFGKSFLKFTQTNKSRAKISVSVSQIRLKCDGSAKSRRSIE